MIEPRIAICSGRRRWCRLIPVGLVVAGVGLAGCERQTPPGSAVDESDPEPVFTLPDESAYTPGPGDGGGTVSVSPDHVVAGQPCTLTFTYTAGPHGIAVGGGVWCQVTRFWYWQPPQNQSPRAPGYCTVRSSEADLSLSVDVDPGTFSVVARLDERRLEPGEKLLFTYGDTSDGASPTAHGIADRFAEREERFYFKVDGDGDAYFTAIQTQPTFDVWPGLPARLAVFGPTMVTVGTACELRVSALDRANNRATSFIGKLQLRAEPPIIELPERVVIDAAHAGSCGVKVVPKKPGLVRVLVHAVDDPELMGRSNSMVAQEPTAQQYQLLWADLHGHGNRSDGTGTPDDWYDYAQDVARLDVAALTEHDHWGHAPLDERPAEWQRILSATADHYAPGTFVTFFGYEWTNWTFGHMHVLFAKRKEAELFSWHKPQSDHPEKLWACLGERDCLTVPHHPGGGPIPTCWKYYSAKFQPVVEIANVHGVSERMGAPGTIYHATESGMVQHALARGYRLGLVGGGDTHDGHPGLGTPGAPRPGLAGIWAEATTREAVFAALRARRTYAAVGGRPVVRFYAEADDNTRVSMGGTLAIDDPQRPRRFGIKVVGDGPLRQLNVVKNNVDVFSVEVDGNLAYHVWKDSTTAVNGDTYYLRVYQADGARAWSSPIWIELD